MQLKTSLSVALAAALITACGPKVDPETVVDQVLTTGPFDGAFAVIVPRYLPAACGKLPASEEGKAYAVLVNSGFMTTQDGTTADGKAACQLLLTDKGANRKTFGRIVTLADTYEVPVGGIGTDLPVYKETVVGDTVNVSFTWKFYRFRGVDGLIALTKLPQRKKGVLVADVPHAGTANAMFRRQDNAWKLEGVRLVQ